MRDNTLISIVVPIYNTAKYLDKCVGTLVSQSYADIEIILVDDGSPDESPAMCDKWAIRDKRIKVIHKTNGGLSDARNCGLRIARGDYIIFIDSDDWVDTDMMKVLISTAIKYEADIVNCQFVEEKNRNTNTKLQPRYPLMAATASEGIFLLIKDTIVTNHVWRNLFKKEVLHDIEFPKGKNFEDIHIMHEIFFKSKKIVFIGDVLYHYFTNPEGIVRTKSDKNSMDYLEAFKKRELFFQENMPEALDVHRTHMFRKVYGEWKQIKKRYNDTKKEETRDLLLYAESILIKFPLRNVLLEKMLRIILLKVRYLFKKK